MRKNSESQQTSLGQLKAISLAGILKKINLTSPHSKVNATKNQQQEKQTCQKPAHSLAKCSLTQIPRPLFDTI